MSGQRILVRILGRSEIGRLNIRLRRTWTFTNALREHHCYKNRADRAFCEEIYLTLLQCGYYFRERSNWCKYGVILYFLEVSLGSFVTIKPMNHDIFSFINDLHHQPRPRFNESTTSHTWDTLQRPLYQSPSSPQHHLLSSSHNGLYGDNLPCKNRVPSLDPTSPYADASTHTCSE